MVDLKKNNEIEAKENLLPERPKNIFGTIKEKFQKMIQEDKEYLSTAKGKRDSIIAVAVTACLIAGVVFLAYQETEYENHYEIATATISDVKCDTEKVRVSRRISNRTYYTEETKNKYYIFIEFSDNNVVKYEVSKLLYDEYSYQKGNEVEIKRRQPFFDMMFNKETSDYDFEDYDYFLDDTAIYFL